MFGGGGLGIFTEDAQLLTSGGFGRFQALELQVLNKRFFKTKEVVEALKLSEHKARKVLVDRDVNYIKIGRAHYYRKADIEILEGVLQNERDRNITN